MFSILQTYLRPKSLLRCGVMLYAILSVSHKAYACELSKIPVTTGDFVIQVNKGGYEILAITEQRGDFDLVAKGDSTEYTCDNDPPKPGDSCTCGGTGFPDADRVDCMFLKLECKEGAFSEKEGKCSDFDPIPIDPTPIPPW